MSGARSVDVQIVGAGVIGLSIAERLAGEGLSVRVLDAEGVGSGASGAAAGMLAPLSETAPGSTLRSLGTESLARFPELCARLEDETGIDPEWVESGLLHVARAGSEAEALRARFPDGPLAGQSGVEWLDRRELAGSEPALSPDFELGCLSPGEAHVRPPQLVRALAASARQRGVHIEAGVRVLGLRRERDRLLGVDSSEGPRDAAVTVIAAGAATPALLRGEPALPQVEIEPVRGQILSLEPPLPKRRTICWGPDVYLVPKQDGSWVIGATEERVGFDRRVTAEGVARLLERARRVFPALAEATFGRAWAGLRPVSADGLPWVGPAAAVEGLWIAAGHGRNGVLLAPVTARIVCDRMLGRPVGPEAGALAPSRSPRPPRRAPAQSPSVASS